VINCTFSANLAIHNGGGMYNTHDSNPTVINSVLWGNSDSGGTDESAQIHGGSPAVNYSCIQGLDTFAGDCNIGDDPLFVDSDGEDDTLGTEDDDLRLLVGSPCIDAGNSDVVPPDIDTDLVGNARFVDDPALPDCPHCPEPADCGESPIVDMGAYELQPIYVGLDVRPGGCPNPLNRNSHGILPVAVVGTDDLDVMQIEVSSVLLWRADGVGGSVAPNEGPPAPHSTFEDVATPFEGEACDCHDETGDGVVDLVLKFRTDAVVEALLLDELNHGDEVELIITGTLVGGAGLTTAGDCVLIVPQGTSNANVTSNVAGLFVELSPADLNVDDSGFASFQRIYNPGTVITLTAPPQTDGLLFHAWLVDGVVQNAGQTTIDVTVVEDLTARAVYLSATPDPTLGPRLAPTSRQPASR
jgi:hypothetical protein